MRGGLRFWRPRLLLRRFGGRWRDGGGGTCVWWLPCGVVVFGRRKSMRIKSRNHGQGLRLHDIMGTDKHMGIRLDEVHEYMRIRRRWIWIWGCFTNMVVLQVLALSNQLSPLSRILNPAAIAHLPLPLLPLLRPRLNQALLGILVRQPAKPSNLQHLPPNSHRTLPPQLHRLPSIP